MLYDVKFTENAKNDLAKLRKNEPSAYKKALKLAFELTEHPTTGTGKPEQLKGERAGQWSRRITKKHRLIYEIHDNIVEVYVLSAYGHYEDK